MLQDAPDETGVYVAYVNSEMTTKWAGRVLLMWQDGKWWHLGSDQKYRGHVYACIGPLPALALDD